MIQTIAQPAGASSILPESGSEDDFAVDDPGTNNSENHVAEDETETSPAVGKGQTEEFKEP